MEVRRVDPQKIGCFSWEREGRVAGERLGGGGLRPNGSAQQMPLLQWEAQGHEEGLSCSGAVADPRGVPGVSLGVGSSPW